MSPDPGSCRDFCPSVGIFPDVAKVRVAFSWACQSQGSLRHDRG